jgi:SM-20-related protein
MLAINPDLDLDAAAAIYARDGIVRVGHVLTPETADAVARLMLGQFPWRLTFSDEDDPKAGLYDAARIQAVGPEALNAEHARALTRARDGFAYIYLSYPMITAYLEGWDRGHPVHAVSELINGPLLEVFRQVTGVGSILKADAQATLYRPGDFLSLHDDGKGEGRIAAYTLGLTRAWRPDWGGQLLFHDADGEITRGLAPAFNCLTMFSTPRSHSVAPVAPYAGAPRLSIVGWARNDPKR